MNRKIKILARVIAVLILITAAFLYIDRPRTPSFSDSSGVASLEDVHLGGIKQKILVRGRDRTNPILLFLHGGPGMPAMYLAHYFQKDLENHFVVVHWDQRGAGKSYNDQIPPGSMSVTQLMADSHELVEKLRTRFHQQRIYLAAHSWGTYLGILTVKEYPDLFHAYIGIGQVAETREKEIAIQDKFIEQSAIQAGKPEVVEDLKTNRGAVREKYLFQFGGELHSATSFMPLLLTGLRSPEYTFLDAMKIPKGVSFTHKHMKYDAIQGSIIENVKEIRIPAYFFTGRYDYASPYELIEAYVEQLEAPSKRLVWFEHSAHFPFYEEREQFTQEVLKVLSESTSSVQR